MIGGAIGYLTSKLGGVYNGKDPKISFFFNLLMLSCIVQLKSVIPPEDCLLSVLIADLDIFRLCPLRLVDAYYLQPPDARAIFLHNDLI